MKLTSVAVSGVPDALTQPPVRRLLPRDADPGRERQREHPERDAAEPVAGERDADGEQRESTARRAAAS